MHALLFKFPGGIITKEKNLNDALSNLVRLDIDAVHAYNQVLKEIVDPIIKAEMKI